MSDTREDYKRQAWEDKHADEFDQPCPDCGMPTLSKGADFGKSRYEPGGALWACPCGYEEER